MIGPASVTDHVEKQAAVTAYLNAVELFDRQAQASREASKREDAARTHLHEAKKALAAEYGFSVGDEPMSIAIPSVGKVIRLSTSQRDRCCGSGRDERSVVASIEKLA